LAEVTPTEIWSGKFILKSQFLDMNKLARALAHDPITLISHTRMKHHGISGKNKNRLSGLLGRTSC
jgi:hypothetical protein